MCLGWSMILNDGERIIIQGRADQDGHWIEFQVNGERHAVAMSATVEEAIEAIRAEMERSGQQR